MRKLYNVKPRIRLKWFTSFECEVLGVFRVTLFQQNRLDLWFMNYELFLLYFSKRFKYLCSKLDSKCVPKLSKSRSTINAS